MAIEGATVELVAALGGAAAAATLLGRNKWVVVPGFAILAVAEILLGLSLVTRADLEPAFSPRLAWPRSRSVLAACSRQPSAFTAFRPGLRSPFSWPRPFGSPSGLRETTSCSSFLCISCSRRRCWRSSHGSRRSRAEVDSAPLRGPGGRVHPARGSVAFLVDRRTQRHDRTRLLPASVLGAGSRRRTLALRTLDPPRICGRPRVARLCIHRSRALATQERRAFLCAGPGGG